MLLWCEMGIRVFYLYLSSTKNHGTVWFRRDLWKSLPDLLCTPRPALKLDPASGLNQGAQGCHRFSVVYETSRIELWVRGRGLGELVGQGLPHVSSWCRHSRDASGNLGATGGQGLARQVGGCGLCTPEAPRPSPRCAGEQARPKGGVGGEAVERGQEPAHSYSCRSSCGFPMRPWLSLPHAGKGAAAGSMRKLAAPRNKRGYETAVLLPSLTHVLQLPPRGRQTFPFGKDFGLHSEKGKQKKEASANELQSLLSSTPVTCALSTSLLPAPAPGREGADPRRAGALERSAN